jgi:hypothetical protein
MFFILLFKDFKTSNNIPRTLLLFKKDFLNKYSFKGEVSKKSKYKKSKLLSSKV